MSCSWRPRSIPITAAGSLISDSPSTRWAGLDEAIDAYRRALEIEPGDVQALQHLGTDLQQTQRFAEAISTFEQIEKIDPSIENCYCGRILCYSELGQHEKAEEIFLSRSVV